jgi:hypothetical protein
MRSDSEVSFAGCVVLRIHLILFSIRILLLYPDSKNEKEVVVQLKRMGREGKEGDCIGVERYYVDIG